MLKLDKAIEKCFNRANLEGSDVDLYRIMYQYKAIAELPTEQIEQIYDDLADRLGFYNHNY